MNEKKNITFIFLYNNNFDNFYYFDIIKIFRKKIR